MKKSIKISGDGFISEGEYDLVPPQCKFNIIFYIKEFIVVCNILLF